MQDHHRSSLSNTIPILCLVASELIQKGAGRNMKHKAFVILSLRALMMTRAPCVTSCQEVGAFTGLKSCSWVMPSMSSPADRCG